MSSLRNVLSDTLFTKGSSLQPAIGFATTLGASGLWLDDTFWVPGIMFMVGGVSSMRVTASGAMILGHTVWHAGNDGAGSGLDSDLLDGRDWDNVMATSGAYAGLGGLYWNGAAWSNYNAAGKFGWAFRHGDGEGVTAGAGGALSFLFGQTASTGPGSPGAPLATYTFDKNGKFTAPRIVSTVASGTAPFIVASNTKVSNLNVDYLNGVPGSGYSLVGHNHDGVYEPVFSKGNIVAGAGVTITGVLTGRLYGPGDVVFTSTVTGVIAHNLLTGLGADDHPHYHNDARGDARYLRLTGGTVTGTTTFSGSSTLLRAPNPGAALGYVLGTTDDPTSNARTVSHRTLSQFKSDLGIAIADVSGLQAALNAKSNIGHTHDATEIVSGTLSSARLSGGYTGITSVGTLTSLVVSGATFISAANTVAATHVAIFTADPTSGATIRSRTTGQFLYDIGASPIGHQHDASEVSSGTFTTNRMGFGTADSTKYLRGDRQWSDLNTTAVAGFTTFGRSLVNQSDATATRTLIDAAATSHNHAWSHITSGKPTTLGGYGITDAVPITRAIYTTHSIQGGAQLDNDRTLSLVGDEPTPGPNKFYGTNGAGDRGWNVFPDWILDTRRVDTAGSLTGGGRLNGNLTLQLVNDDASPGNNKVYGTNSSGVKTWRDVPPTGVPYPTSPTNGFVYVLVCTGTSPDTFQWQQLSGTNIV